VHPPPDPVISAQLTEVTQGEWQVRIAGPSEAVDDLGDKPIAVQMTVEPNLVPGVPFAATLILARRDKVAD
jgi:hypothetical protein